MDKHLMSEAKYYLLIGFLLFFNFMIYLLILVGYWPHMDQGLIDGTYPYKENIEFVIAGSLFNGLLGSIGASFVYAMEHQEW